MAKHVKMVAQPFLKWAGGKRQLLPAIRLHLPVKFPRIANYYEPFIGGGAVLFGLQPKKAVVNDVNQEIVNAYQIIRDQVEELVEDLKKHRNDAKYYYGLRELDREPGFSRLSGLQKASRTIFLNKTCFNGLFRVNSKGQFNVPFGKYKNPNFVDTVILKAVSIYLNKAEITFLKGDFEDAVRGITRNSFVYFDPPYHPISETSSFTGYSLDGFGEEEQKRLKRLCDKLHGAGVKFLLSNSCCDFIRKLYKGYEIIEIPAARSINSVGNGRGKISEVLIKNYG